MRSRDTENGARYDSNGRDPIVRPRRVVGSDPVAKNEGDGRDEQRRPPHRADQVSRTFALDVEIAQAHKGDYCQGHAAGCEPPYDPPIDRPVEAVHHAAGRFRYRGVEQVSADSGRRMIPNNEMSTGVINERPPPLLKCAKHSVRHRIITERSAQEYRRHVDEAHDRD